MKAMDRIKVYEAAEKIEAEMLVEMLKRNQVSAYRQGKGSGGYMDIYAGNSIYGEDIYVDAEDEESAKKLIEEMTAEVAPDAEDGEESQCSGGEAPPSSRYTPAQKLAGKIILVVLCALILFSVLNSVFG